jgi:hypothetical protein
MALTAKVREEVLLSGDCAYCGGLPTQVDHIVPLSRGGTDDRSNLVPACKGCNMEKLDFTPEEYRTYREEKGLGWPPRSMGDQILDLIRAEAERTGEPLGILVDGFVASLREHPLPLVAPDERAPAGCGRHEPFVFQDRDGLADGVVSRARVDHVHEVPQGRQPVGDLPRCDLVPELSGDLLVGIDGAGHIHSDLHGPHVNES